MSPSSTYVASKRIAGTADPAAPVRLVGLDDAGEPFLIGDRLFRGIYEGHAAAVRDVLAVCEANDLFEHGVVATREPTGAPHPVPGYEAILEHDRVRFVSYPHEWPASMFKDACRFHVALFERLHENGLTLKDWHPWNILFDGTKPVFVDFTSIIRFGSLARQVHLAGARAPQVVGAAWDDASMAVYEMYRLMFEPYFGLPLAMMAHHRNAEARLRLYETTLNASHEAITRREVFASDRVGRLRYELDDRLLQARLLEKGPNKRRFFSRVRKAVDARDVVVTGSAYSSYYEEKSEAFAAEPVPEWTSKQHVVHDAVVRFAPRTVLDLGSNTGWFSMLAAKLGCSVVAVDLDEACIDRLYRAARREGLDILPLVVNLTAPLPELRPRAYPNEPSRSLLNSDAPLIQSPVRRLRCEMVLALAVVHHLALGQALTFARIASILDELAERFVCIEFVSIDDRMITSDRSFFPAYDGAPGAFGWYRQDNFVAALGEHFSTVDVLPSYPDSRTLLVCSR